METQITNNPPIPTQEPSDGSQKTNFAVVVVIVILLAVAGIAGIYWVKQNQSTENLSVTSTPSPIPTTKPEKRIELQGKLVAKTNDTFTLEEDGKQVVIHFLDTYTKIYAPPSAKELTLADLKLGTKMSGSALVRAADKSTNTEELIIGEIFRVPTNLK